MGFPTTRSESANLPAADLQVAKFKCAPDLGSSEQRDGFAEVIGPHYGPVVEIVFMPEGAVFCFHRCNNMIVSQYEQ